jgi:CDP-diacylglycerol---serine O-phosphatidyltransferase
MKKYIPNFITSLNLASGFFAIIFAAAGDTLTASWLILAAMIFDFSDGFAARLLKAYSDLGKELDSLADVVSFGVAPAYLIYILMHNALSQPAAPAFVTGTASNLLLLIPALMPVCAALRLAIFNLDTTQSTTFKGLPTPANAIAVIAFIIAGHYSESTLIGSISTSPVLLAVLTVVLSLLMVSRIPLLSLKVKDLRFKGNEGRYILAALVLLSFVFFGTAAAPMIIPLYIAASFLALLF